MLRTRSNLVFALIVIACDLGGSSSTTPPLDGEARAKGAPTATRPFIVNWAPTERTALETRATEGTIVIAVKDEDVRVLPRCRAPGAYRFVGSSHASQTMSIENQAELGAKLPFSGPVDLGATLQAYGLLTVEYHSIGEWRLDRDVVAEAELTGDCTGASHVLGSLSVGAFEFFAGNKVGGGVTASVPMAAEVGAKASQEYKHLDKGGDKAACEAAIAGAEKPTERCDSVVAIELVLVDRPTPFVVGQKWQGSYTCGQSKAAAVLEVLEVPSATEVKGLFSFDYGKAKGSYTVKGTYDAAASSFALAFDTWREQPPSFTPINPSGTLSGDRREFSGALTEQGCTDFSLLRRE
ncbi:MAG TPA: hypothetical protein VG755_35885 [Nannocystaceae bacterium]|nr:hypothetical protein [Nannocystaceae bacterium]